MADIERPPTFVSRGLFVRQSTGLVRDVSPFSAGIFNVLAGAPGASLAVSIFWVLSAYPGGHLITSYWFMGVLGLAISLPFAFLSMTMPRSGGDYVLVSRTLGPPFGVASSLTLAFAVLLINGFLAVAAVRFGIAPVLAAIGVLSGHQWFIDASNTVGHRGWTLGLALGFVAIAIFLGGIRLRRAMLIQNIGFMLGIVGLAAMTITLLVVSKESFATSFNQFAGTGAYDKILNVGGLAKPGTSWANTLPMIAVISGSLAYSWWSVAYAGEIRAARSWKTLATMTVSLGFFVVLLTITTAALYHGVGDAWLADANALNGTEDYPLAAAPFWWVLTGIATKSVAFTVFLALTYIVWYPLLIWLNLGPPFRALFAWAFDGILPQGVTYVSPRTRAPLISLAISGAASIACVIWANYSSSFFTIVATGLLLTFIPILLVSAGAVALPYLRREIWQQSPLQRVRVAGIPLISILGGLGFAAGAFIIWIFVHYRGLGLTNRRNVLIESVAPVAAGFLIYYVARAIRRRRGVDIALNYREIPPE